MKSSATSIFLLFLFLLTCNFLSAQNWELKKDKGGIKVYVREQKDSDIKELKFTTYVNASMQTIASVLTHVEGYDIWSYGCYGSRVVKRISDSENYYYCKVDFPWPFDNRDLVLHSKIWQDKKSLALHSKSSSVHWMEKEHEEFVRIKKAEINWVFTPMENGRVRVDYSLNSDPGGNIPAWMINLAADQGPLKTMLKFKEMLELERYKNSKLAFVTNAK